MNADTPFNKRHYQNVKLFLIILLFGVIWFILTNLNTQLKHEEELLNRLILDRELIAAHNNKSILWKASENEFFKVIL